MSAAVAAATPAAPSPLPLLTLKRLGIERGGRWLVRDLQLEVPRGKLVAVVGPSGVGKSSLLSCLAGMLAPGEGDLTYCCRAGCYHPAHGFQKRIGIVFQDFRLVANASALTNVLCGRLGRYPWWRTIFGFPRAERVEAAHLLAELGLGPVTHRPVRGLSGGEQQRVALARAFFQEPEILLADEPISNLDAPLAERVMQRLKAHGRASHCTIFCVLHQPEIVRRHADWILQLNPCFPERWELTETPHAGRDAADAVL